MSHIQLSATFTEIDRRTFETFWLVGYLTHLKTSFAGAQLIDDNFRSFQ